MALYMIERTFPQPLQLDAQGAKAVGEINDACGVGWKHSYVSTDGMRTYCVYEAPNEQAIRDAAAKAGLPADEIRELGGVVRPEQFG